MNCTVDITVIYKIWVDLMALFCICKQAFAWFLHILGGYWSLGDVKYVEIPVK